MLQLTSKIPLFSGFNISETRIRTPDGKVLKEADFHKFSREMHGCLSWEFAGKHTIQVSFHSYFPDMLYYTVSIDTELLY